MDEVGMLRRLYIGSLKRSIRKADTVVALTEGDAKDWKAYNDNVHVIQNIVTLNESGFYTSFKQKSVIYVGRFSKQKDIDSLLRIWAIIHQQYPDWQLDIYGEGELKDNYLSIIQKMNANINVFQPTANIMEVYREHSILLLTSLYEPFGLVLPEAMSCGLPVVAFDCPYGPADIITDGVDGYLIEDRDVELFAQRVGQLISDYDLRVQMGKAGIASSKRYQASCIIPQWIQLFEQLTSSRGK
jgi:glycosyltransferase involved in cell wall biosynthesis